MATHKPKGYHRLAALMGTYPETAIFRRFGTLNMLNLLSLQAELLAMQADFKEIWKEDDGYSPTEKPSKFSTDFFELRTSLGDPNNHQYQMLVDIREKLREYNSSLLEAAELAKLRQPQEADINFLREWLIGKTQGDGFLDGIEAFTWEGMDEKEGELLDKDLVALQMDVQEQDSFSRLLSSKILQWYHRAIGSRRQGAFGHKVIDPESGIMQYSNAALIRFNNIVVTVVSSAIPVLAIVALYFVRTTFQRIGVLVAFTFLFAFSLAAFTDARRLEIFASTSAFVAIEVVFIGTVLPGR